MTTFHSVIVDMNKVVHITTTDAESSESLEYAYRDKGYSVHSFGDINSDVYVVVYEHPDYLKDKEGEK